MRRLVRRDAAQQENKIRTSASAYFQPAFVAQPSQWAFDQERSTAEFHNRRHVGRPGLYRNLPPETVPREPTRTNLRPATSPTPRIFASPRRPVTKRSGLSATPAPSTRHRPTTRRALSPGDAHDAPTSALADTPRPLPAVQRPDAGIRVSPHRTSRPAPVRPPSGRVFRSASPKGPSSASRDLDSDRLADVRANLARGNHKSARGHEAKLISMLKDGSRLAATTAARSRLRDQGMRGRASGDGRADVDRRKEIQ
ncbi:hypothetical protein MHU86_23391 [Fragilaria crotonensis]|nr:hypothetical protein MHU86_23391 [Fragilaria crotonensis]